MTEQKPSSKSLRILIVDDSRVNRMVAKSFLSDLGHEVTEATSGAEAIDCLKRESFDLVTMDCQMPDMDGFEATRRILTLPDPHPIIIAMTADDKESVRQACLSAGMTDAICKPFSMEIFQEKIQQHFHHSAAVSMLPHQSEPTMIIDTKTLYENFEGIEDVVDQMIVDFLKDYLSLIEPVRAAVKADDPVGLSAATHKIKGVISNFRAEPARAAAERLENTGRDGKLSEAPLLLQNFEKELRNLLHALKKLQSERAA